MIPCRPLAGSSWIAMNQTDTSTAAREPTGAASPDALTFVPATCLQLLFEARYDALSENFLQILDRIEAFVGNPINDSITVQLFIDSYVLSLLYAFSQPAYHLADHHVVRFLAH